MAKNETTLKEVNDAIETRANGTPEKPQTGGSPLTVVRARVSSPVALAFEALASKAGAEYGHVLEMGMLAVIEMPSEQRRELYEAVLKSRATAAF